MPELRALPSYVLASQFEHLTDLQSLNLQAVFLPDITSPVTGLTCLSFNTGGDKKPPATIHSPMFPGKQPAGSPISGTDMLCLQFLKVLPSSIND